MRSVPEKRRLPLQRKSDPRKTDLYHRQPPANKGKSASGQGHRAIRFLKLGEIEKGKSLLRTVVEATNGCCVTGSVHPSQQIKHGVPDFRRTSPVVEADDGQLLPQGQVFHDELAAGQHKQSKYSPESTNPSHTVGPSERIACRNQARAPRMATVGWVRQGLRGLVLLGERILRRNVTDTTIVRMGGSAEFSAPGVERRGEARNQRVDLSGWRFG